MSFTLGGLSASDGCGREWRQRRRGRRSHDDDPGHDLYNARYDDNTRVHHHDTRDDCSRLYDDASALSDDDNSQSPARD